MSDAAPSVPLPAGGLPLSPESLRDILVSSPVGISISRVRDGLILDMNDEFLRILGFARKEAVGRTSGEIALWDVPGQREGIVAEFRASGRFAPRPVAMRRRDGSAVTVLFSASPLAFGAEPHAVAWAVDITDRLRTEEALRAAEEKWRTLLGNAPVVILTVDEDGKILSINRTITGRPLEEYLGRKPFDFLHPDYRERGEAVVASVIATGQAAGGEFPILKPDGSAFWFQASVAPFPPGRGPERAVIVATDINERRRVEVALRESEQRFGDIVRSLGDWVWEADAAGRMTYSSSQVLQVLGYRPEEILGKTRLDSIVPEEFARLEEGLKRYLHDPRPFRDHEEWHLHKGGRRVCISVSGVPVFGPGGDLRGFRGVIQDVTERKREERERRRMEDEVHQGRRIESLGMLAGGIAHDFNNLLAVILGNAELALATLEEDAAVRPLLAQVQTAANHAAELTRQMLAYAGRGRFSTERVDLSAAVRAMSQLLAASIPKDVELAFDLAEGLPAVEADPGQVRQVVMNLVINGAEAARGGTGRVTVRTGAGGTTVAGADLVLGRIARGKEAVVIEVADTGRGMDRETLQRIFDPFFTTKFTGRGLGLAAVQGIVLRHQGILAVTSAPGAGSIFRVLLPAAGLSGPAPAVSPAAEAAAPALWRGEGTVLVVDDEEPVRTMAARMLRAIGFDAATAAGGGEAAALLGAGGREVRAVLLDLTMPHMDGCEAFVELRRLRPEVPVILCSGYDVLESTDRFSSLDFAGFLQKPYRVAELTAALRKALGG